MRIIKIYEQSETAIRITDICFVKVVVERDWTFLKSTVAAVGGRCCQLVSNRIATERKPVVGSSETKHQDRVLNQGVAEEELMKIDSKGVVRRS